MLGEPQGRETPGGSITVLRIGQFFPEPWLAPCRPTTTRPARPRWAGAESRSFERCAPTTSRRDPTPASSTPLRAHGPRAAHICTSTTAMRTRCGEGDLVGGWHAGASPSIPIMRRVTHRRSSSASLAKPSPPSAGLSDFDGKGASQPRSRWRSSFTTGSSAPASCTSHSRLLASQQGR